MAATEQDVLRIGAELIDEQCPLSDRFRALFTLRNIGGATALAEISKCLTNPVTSALLKHECAYCLGQMQDDAALPILKQVLSDTTQNSMVRHEAGEALAAIDKQAAIPTLQQFTNDPSPEVAETCQLAIDRLNWTSHNQHFPDNNPYKSIDPAPPQLAGDLSKWSHDLVDHTLSLFTRYRAMFALRNMGGEGAVRALTTGLSDSSVLFKHEIAYVLGQMQEPSSVTALHEKLSDLEEHGMVRHECAEALGSIASEECLVILRHYARDEERVVRESCEVALDMYAHEHSDDFQYANLLKNN